MSPRQLQALAKRVADDAADDDNPASAEFAEALAGVLSAAAGGGLGDWALLPAVRRLARATDVLYRQEPLPKEDS